MALPVILGGIGGAVLSGAILAGARMSDDSLARSIVEPAGIAGLIVSIIAIVIGFIVCR